VSAPKRSAGFVVLRQRLGEPRYLLLRCYDYWDFPKGEAEPGEPPLQTAIREVTEETSLRDLQFSWGEQFHETAAYGKGKVARYYLAESPAGEVALPINPELGRPEHHEFRWMSYPQARQRLNDRLRAVLDWAQSLATHTGEAPR
jgi:8-oxo-dGTP pyrophosphatase MutT (NUDIX family)